jgi:hypothetical protein
MPWARVLWVNGVMSEEFNVVPLAEALIQAEWHHSSPGSGSIKGGRAGLQLSSGKMRSGDDMGMGFNLVLEIRQANPVEDGAVGA